MMYELKWTKTIILAALLALPSAVSMAQRTLPPTGAPPTATPPPTVTPPSGGGSPPGVGVGSPPTTQQLPATTGVKMIIIPCDERDPVTGRTIHRQPWECGIKIRCEAVCTFTGLNGELITLTPDVTYVMSGSGIWTTTAENFDVAGTTTAALGAAGGGQTQAMQGGGQGGGGGGGGGGTGGEGGGTPTGGGPTGGGGGAGGGGGGLTTGGGGTPPVGTGVSSPTTSAPQ
jgi:hypothetical protein